MMHFLKSALLGSVALLASLSAAQAVDLEFYFPVAVGGDAATLIENMTTAYMAENPEVNISAVYTGSYADTTTRVITAARGGNAPQLAILLSTDMFTMIDEDIVEAWDDHLSAEEMADWVGGFYPAFLKNSQTEGKTWGIPFQRSTPVIYWNKEAFAAAGLDPEVAPATWDEMVEMGKKLTVRDDAGAVTQWGVLFPSSGFPSWLYTGLVAANGGILANEAGTEVYFDTPEAVEALEYLVSLSGEHEVMQPGILDWGATPRAFMDGQAAIIWTTTGNLGNIRTNAPFEFGVGMLPAKTQPGAPTGGGNFYLFSGNSDEETRAAIDFVKWATEPTQAAAWSIATGYVAPRADTWETAEMKAYVEEVPGALVARNQLDYAVAELSTFQGPRVTQILNDNIAAAIVGDKTPAQALADAQRDADAVLADYR